MRYLIAVLMMCYIWNMMETANYEHWRSPQGQAEAKANLDRLTRQLIHAKATGDIP